MATITFRYQPSYDQKDTDVSMIEPTVEYSFEIPDSTSLNNGLSLNDIQLHFDQWLASLGY